jgi:hypothetical protein
MQQTFNKKTHDNWSDDLRGARKIVSKNKDDKRLWYRTTIIHEVEASFSLCCATCNKAFDIKNPASFCADHYLGDSDDARLL